ncbi:TetR/AcrR family transcriptional regulator [Nocardia bovistercoris]|uniref:TetR/AcrR family transcriptional regulator n=1 Tax=Nocardia bovistercoris TaxID=2785916 RepID=A0A931IHN1_9NOCA|nr:TetR/AcrR family transcriptional regulator [Nocardia bovistercoris]MBH0780197.1 TetR/AcrR family transcriptional regulator [Nocardia bovistercoris]
MTSVTRIPRAPREPDGDRRAGFEQRVLHAVEELLADGTPYTEIAVQKIAAASGAARSTFYRYFPDKSSLLIRMAELATADLFATAERWWAAEHGDRDGVVRAISAMIASFREHRHLLLALSEVAAYDKEVGAYWRKRLAVFADLVRRRLEVDRERGAIGSAVDPATTAIVLTAMVERSITAVFADSGSAIADDVLAAALGRVTWLAVYGDAPGGDGAV